MLGVYPLPYHTAFNVDLEALKMGAVPARALHCHGNTKMKISIGFEEWHIRRYHTAVGVCLDEIQRRD